MWRSRSSDTTPLFSSNSRKKEEGVVVEAKSSDPTPLFSSNSIKEKEGVVVEAKEIRSNPNLL